MQEHLRLGREAWPGVELSDDDFAKRLEALVADGGAPPIERAADLWIASACTLGVPGAVAAFEKKFRGTLERAVARVDRSVVDDGVQQVMLSLLVREGDTPPRIAAYSGRSALSTWLTTVATRAAFKLRRNKDDQPHEALSQVEAVIAAEPELAFAKVRYGRELEASLREALASLDERQIVLLRLHHAKGWSVDRLGTLYGVGRSTAARWVAAAREALLESTKARMRARIGVTSSELASLLEVLRSNLEVSLLRLLDSDE